MADTNSTVAEWVRKQEENTSMSYRSLAVP